MLIRSIDSQWQKRVWRPWPKVVVASAGVYTCLSDHRQGLHDRQHHFAGFKLNFILNNTLADTDISQIFLSEFPDLWACCKAKDPVGAIL